MANGKKGNGKWIDRWREGGHHRQRTFDRRGDRDLFRMERIRRQQLGGLVRLEEAVTLAEFMEDYWRLRAVPTLEPGTRATYLQQWGKHILPRLGDYNLRAITPRIIASQLVEPMRKAKCGDPTVLYVLAVLQAIFKYALDEERVSENPVRKVPKPRQATDREVAPVPPATVERLRARLGARDSLMVPVLAYAGLRPQELLALHWEDVGDGAIVVRRKNVDGKIYGYTKTRKDRRVKLLAPLGADLAEHALATGRRTGIVVPHETVGRGPSTSTSPGVATSTSRTPAPSGSRHRFRMTCAGRSCRCWPGRATPCSRWRARPATAWRCAIATTPGSSRMSIPPSA